MALLDKINAKLSANDRSGALDLLLTAWAKNASPAVAEAIDALDTVFANERGARIRAIAGQTMADTVTMLRRAQTWRDPRLTHVLAGLLRQLPWSGARSRATWRDVFEVIAKHGDPRLIAIAKTLPATWTVGQPLQTWLANQLASAVERMPVVQPHPEEAAIAAFATSLRAQGPTPAATPRNTKSLLAAIYASPADDTPRLIYADWLQERGDPRGELIALQLGGTKTKREAQLLVQHKKAWLGPLANVLHGDVNFRRGFPAAGTVIFRNQRDVEQFGHLVEWATIEELAYSDTIVRDDQKLWSRYLGPAQRHVRIARSPAIEHLLAAKTPWALEQLDLDGNELDDPVLLEQLLSSGLVPELRGLGLFGWGPEPTWIENVTTLPETFAISAALADDEVLTWLRALAPNARTETFEIRQYGGLVHRFSRDKAGAFSRLVTVIHPAKKAKTRTHAAPTLALYRAGIKKLRSTLTHSEATIEIADKMVAV